MSKLRFKISMSLDGFVAGPNQSVKDPIGVGGMRLHQWVFPLKAWRSMHGLQGGEVNESNRVVEESLANIGATVMGRNMFGGHPGAWDPKKPWNGWWGANPPFHHPAFALTHHPREPLELEGGTTLNFVTNGIEAALERSARPRAGAHGRRAQGDASQVRKAHRCLKIHRWWLAFVATLAVAVAVTVTFAASPPVPPALSELAAKAGVDGPFASWCAGEFRLGQPAFAVAAGSARKGGRYVVIESDGKTYELSSYKGGAEVACYTPGEAKRIDATIAASEAIHGSVSPRWPTTVVCGFVENTEAVCWQYSPAEARFVKVGGWIT